MRYIILGAGAIGGAIGGRLVQAGREVTLVARGAHLDALRASGLTLVSAEGEIRLSVDVAGSVAEASPRPSDVVILATKSQDTEPAVADLDALAVPDLAVVAAQNGVANEALIARRGFATYGQCVMMGTTHLEPGAIEIRSRGVLDLGRYPSGVDRLAEMVAADLRAAGFDSVARPDILRWKYAKLLGNLGNAIDALAGSDARQADLYRRARAEGEAVLATAGIDYASEEETRERYGDFGERRAEPITLPSTAAGSRPGVSSSWQSLARRTGTVEADWLNGEIVLLGRQHSVPTPVNEALRSLTNRLARERSAPGSLSLAEVEEQVAAFEASETSRYSAH